ncbi:hypothetical protein EG329_006456 [Mollisiaceae sp. DMI_Dod_QoI]|nr:hypothetical protein EG329_006456 [Helotiales sp. DMI_Dod_QoI]
MRSLILTFLGLATTGLVAAQDLKIEVISSVPCTRKTKNGDILSVNYNGTLTNGTTFDSSYSANSSDPFSFTLGAGQVITGWDLGLLDMCIGDKRKLTLPPKFGYGDRAVGPIPPNSTLLFYTELMGMSIQATPRPNEVVN